VINEQTNTVTATIPLAGPPSGVGVDPQTNTAYVATNMGFSSGTVSVISGQDTTVTATIPVGTAPFGVAANPKTSSVYVANFFSGTVSVLAPCPQATQNISARSHARRLDLSTQQTRLMARTMGLVRQPG
jgi:YVTN family beta-propeller protein